MSIQRFIGLRPMAHVEGDFVRYTDHAAEVARLTEERNALKSALASHDDHGPDGRNVTNSQFAAVRAERDAAVAAKERAEEALRELCDRTGEGIGHSFDPWEVDAFLRELRSDVRSYFAAAQDAKPKEDETW